MKVVGNTNRESNQNCSEAEECQYEITALSTTFRSIRIIN